MLDNPAKKQIEDMLSGQRLFRIYLASALVGVWLLSIYGILTAEDQEDHFALICFGAYLFLNVYLVISLVIYGPVLAVREDRMWLESKKSYAFRQRVSVAHFLVLGLCTYLAFEVVSEDRILIVSGLLLIPLLIAGAHFQLKRLNPGWPEIQNIPETNVRFEVVRLQS